MKEYSRQVGQTRDTGFQIGARRTLPIPQEYAWHLVTSREGRGVWLGDTPELEVERNATYKLADGTHGEITVHEPLSHIRLTWQPPGWPRPSIIQVRIMPRADRTAIAFHQEHLPDATAREARKLHYHAALDAFQQIVEQMTVERLLGDLRSAREAWEAPIRTHSEKRLVEPETIGEWSVKDLIAHMTWTERETVGIIRKRAFVGSEWWRLPLDERNAAIYAESKDRTLSDVRAEARRVFADLLKAIETLSDAELNQPNLFAGMPFSLPAWQVIARNTYLHYMAHLPELRSL
jgi:uncharacterized protein YndB with AHSA1/START domain